MKLYLAHPISGLSGKEIFEYYDAITESLGEYFTVLSPMIGKDYLREISEAKPNGYKNPISNDHAIFQRDTWMVSQSDIVLCDFSVCARTSIGCCMELAIASWTNKHTIVVMENENVHYHGFILDAADIVFPTISDAISYLKNFKTK